MANLPVTTKSTPSLQNMIVKWTKTALANLEAIAGYIEKDSPLRARTFIVEIRQKTNALLEFPAMGRPGRILGTRELVVHENYIIPYRVRGGVIQILRVHHVAMRFLAQKK